MREGPKEEGVTREEWKELREYAERTHQSTNTLALAMEGQRVELANQKEHQKENQIAVWEAIELLRASTSGLKVALAGIVAGGSIIQTVVVAYVVYRITH